MPIIDAHIHIDKYEYHEREKLIRSLDEYNVKAIIAVSTHLNGAKKVNMLSNSFELIKPAFGYHPEQDIPDDYELEKLTEFIQLHRDRMVAIGEVGLPYYRRQNNPLLNRAAYLEMLEHFVTLAKKLHKPIVLHAIYDDAPIVCDLLEKHSIEKAHFHWFKGDPSTIDRMIANNYFVSVTPDILYKESTRTLVEKYPLPLLMVETDGPWQFSGPFKNRITTPAMLHTSIREIAEIKQLPIKNVYETIYRTTVKFYLDDTERTCRLL